MNAVVEKSRTMTLTPARRALSEQWRQDWVVNAEDGTTIEDLDALSENEMPHYHRPDRQQKKASAPTGPVTPTQGQ